MLRHTKSTSGRTHCLTFTQPGGLREPLTATVRYHNAPQFDDQAEGDLIRKFWRLYPGVQDVIGRIPNGTQIDPALDALEPADPTDRSRLIELLQRWVNDATATEQADAILATYTIREA